MKKDVIPLGRSLQHLQRIHVLTGRLMGKRVIIRKLGEARPEDDPNKANLIYVPLPEYGIAQWHYTN